jgi:hypothetical protein
MEGIFTLMKCDKKRCAKEYIVLSFKNPTGAAIWTREKYCPDCKSLASRVESAKIHVVINDEQDDVAGKMIRRPLEVGDAVEGDA